MEKDFFLRPIVNLWTFLHAIAGFGIGMVGIKPKYAFLIIIGWEILEQTMLVAWQITWPPELTADSMLDIIMGLAGYFAGLVVNKKIKGKKYYRKYLDVM